MSTSGAGFTSSRHGALLLGVVLIGLALFAGLVAAVGGIKTSLVLVLIILCAASFALSIDSLVLITFVVCTVIAGTVEYFAGGWKTAQWASFGLGFLCLTRLPFEYFRIKRKPGRMARHLSPTVFALGMFFVTLAFSSVLNATPLEQLFVGAKNVLALWSIALLVVIGAIKEKTLKRLWYFMIGLVFLQLPFVIYQHFFVAAARVQGMSEWDAVVGTFGGDPNGGGANPVLVLYLILGSCFAVALWREGTARWLLPAATVCLALIQVGLGEVKAAVLFVPLAAAVLFWDRLRRSPGIAVLFACASVLFVVALGWLYQQLYWSHAGGRTATLTQSIETSYDYFFDPANINWRTGEIGRGASLQLWLNDPKTELPHRLIGHGLGASRSSSSVAVGEVARRYQPLDIAATAISQLLWDVGLIGLASYLLVIILAIGECSAALCRAGLEPSTRAMLISARVVLWLMLAFMPYNRTTVDFAAVEFVLALAVGCAVAGRRFEGEQPAPSKTNFKAQHLQPCNPSVNAAAS